MNENLKIEGQLKITIGNDPKFREINLKKKDEQIQFLSEYYKQYGQELQIIKEDTSTIFGVEEITVKYRVV